MVHNQAIAASAGLGFALGGFFDGILLHQILQWHHLLSLVEGAGDLAAQVIWDGIFHAAMYAVAAVSLLALWRLWPSMDDRSVALLPAGVLLGFGGWHIVDGVLAHWILQIHRIRLDTAYPLAWDIGWMLVFGIVPAVVGGRKIATGGGPTGGARGAPHTLAILAAITFFSGAGAALPIAGLSETTAVVLRRGGAQSLFAMLEATDGRLVWNDDAVRVAIIAVAPKRRWDLYRHGALLVGGTGVLATCLTAVRR